MQRQGKLTWWYQFNSLTYSLDLDNITAVGFQATNMNRTIWLFQKPIVWSDVCNAENVRLNVLLNYYHKLLSSVVFCKLPSSISTTEELQSCSITFQIKSQKEHNTEELLHGAILHRKEIFDDKKSCGVYRWRWSKRVL